MDRKFSQVYQLAADMGGAGYLFSGENDADVMHNSALINLNMLRESAHRGIGKIFYASSACVYPQFNQLDPDNPNCAEDTVYPAYPDSEYGWEKLFSERMYTTFARNHGLSVRIGRFHNIFGPLGTWTGGREKSPAALCRKVTEAEPHGVVEIWGDGMQTRSFLYIDECIEAVRRLMNSSYSEPLNVGSQEMICINDLCRMIADIAGKPVRIGHVPGPLGVRGRNSDNTRIQRVLNWSPSEPLRAGMAKTYQWIAEQVEKQRPVQ